MHVYLLISEAAEAAEDVHTEEVSAVALTGSGHTSFKVNMTLAQPAGLCGDCVFSEMKFKRSH